MATCTARRRCSWREETRRYRRAGRGRACRRRRRGRRSRRTRWGPLSARSARRPCWSSRTVRPCARRRPEPCGDPTTTAATALRRRTRPGSSGTTAPAATQPPAPRVLAWPWRIERPSKEKRKKSDLFLSGRRKWTEIEYQPCFGAIAPIGSLVSESRGLTGLLAGGDVQTCEPPPEIKNFWAIYVESRHLQQRRIKVYLVVPGR